jgi:hypothetical protein
MLTFKVVLTQDHLLVKIRMNIPEIPENIEKWTLETINALIKIRDIESETFEFKRIYQKIFLMISVPWPIGLADISFKA